ncbi:MAG TPA: hypothetical protein DEF39_09965 [Hungateiclostridium thermocellum]|jgi:hypothetical protein|uniref:Uncharacterized protein n=2 Tax=Acetivibrio thermocellus TaxID=1515 RepID=A3DD38_ACET2|nr:hypothetical protein [Acetivibrio thermocellus]CDG35324.1 hypothetical protein CTHBC1_0660 [Acetivibrio thermocellus BC1]HOQ01945.1 hypothetical protein [Acetivibrio clariflavus]ABN51867.1 hypothetical protein Cthe_0632 [Acetivibrio thermocellus ATCC 27405]ADU74656.1 hypothetical protein Clo1313_1595 [Acetivibrio thermocellus DSM 1313]ALX08599.1 hypothetical protein AD2_01606 [Acetivibrio thermocellus AD2]
MAGFAKSLVIVLIVCVVFLITTNFIFFFPWYMTLAYETYNLSTLAAQHNYIDRDEAQMILDNLNKKPFFKENPVTFDDIDGETEPGKLQRGEQFTVSITAKYPIRMDMGIVNIRRDWPVTFSVETTCLYYDKNLDPLYKSDDLIFDEPIYDEPIYYDEPAYDDPSYTGPTEDEPLYDEPAYDDPTHAVPTEGAPPFEEPI